ncbi:MAG: dTDP-4-amino-4,6-dideoxygalactose transaminase [Bacteroidales bacterium]|nr:dTDP-4-amino-4,6-dideoxygalactose transaminase [Lentimicrobiaceae bacterium]MDD5695119.1 dTDP-4-amino-4,6-dideoxygalactose transaminase [Bacteroidales bacterium]
MEVLFNKPYLTGRESHHLARVALSGKLSGNGEYTQMCQDFFRQRFGFGKVLLTTSCSDALEMAAILCDIHPGDEVIMPSYSFVSTANAFLLRGAHIRFADTCTDYPNIDPVSIEKLITPRTRVIVVVHYAGVACDMESVMALARQHDLLVVEDAAHAHDSFFKKMPLGSIGHFGTFSFHETKNIISGEGGMLVVNDKKFEKRAEIIWEKGTDRAAFSRGEVSKYGWKDIGSSFLPSEIIAAMLYAQLEKYDEIQAKRKNIWNGYYKRLKPLAEASLIRLPILPQWATVNGSMFFLITRDPEERDALLSHLKSEGVYAVFHYLPLHSSDFFRPLHDGRILQHTDHFASCIIRLPFYNELTDSEIDFVTSAIKKFYTIL